MWSELSPDGKTIAFFSERDVLSLDLFLADVGSGRIVRKISSINRNFDIDDFSFIETGGTWSPDSRQFGFVVFRKGNTANIGITSGRYYNNNMGGSVNMIFSDIVGNNQLYSVLALNGEIYDFGGQVAHINQTKRIKWGATASHIPYRAGNMFMKLDSLTLKDKDGEYKVPVINLVLDYLRMFEDQIAVFSFHTISQTRRIEAGASSSWYYYRLDRYNNYINKFGLNIGVKKERMPVPKGNNYQKIDIAYVHDNSFFGLTAPLRGQRSRFQIEKYFGAVSFFTGMVDHRNYINLRPFTLASRIYHYGRYGKGSGTDVDISV
jgi:hypothetical protein